MGATGSLLPVLPHITLADKPPVAPQSIIWGVSEY